MKKSWWIVIGILVVLLIAVGVFFSLSQERAWELDDINLMRHRIEGYYGCYGCDEFRDHPVLCVEPVLEMELVEESPGRYCSPDFEIVE